YQLQLLVLETSGHGQALAADPAKECGQSPVIILAPLLIRMMVALGTGHAQAEEDLGGVVHKLLGSLQLLVPHCRGMARFVTVGGQDVAHKRIVRLVLDDGLADPVMEGKGSVPPVRLAAALDPQNGGPFVGEEGG